MKQSYIISCIVIALSLILLSRLQIGSNVVIAETRLDRFPKVIGKYKSHDISMESNLVRILSTDVYVFRNYISPDGKAITLYIGYYGTRKGGRSDHNPEGCYPGAGWSITKVDKVEVMLGSRDTFHRAILNRLDVSRSGTDEIVYHWYQSNRDSIITSGIQANINRFMSRLKYNRNDGAFIRVSSPIDGDPVKTNQILEQFIGDIYPLIVEYWPVERDI